MAKTAAEKVREFRAEAKFQRTSPQKAKLVLDTIKGLRVEQALNTVHFSTKRMAPVIEKVLRSAIQNAPTSRRSRGWMSMSTTSTSAPRSPTKARA
jgi:large subunit ribosomal protein L22